jgi:hypothetical protein
MSLSELAFRSPKRTIPAPSRRQDDSEFRPLRRNDLLVWAGLAAVSWAMVAGVVSLLGA